jgi:lysophospholipid acyltransferase (LPLAT)-like uncharacterized protein
MGILAVVKVSIGIIMTIQAYPADNQTWDKVKVGLPFSLILLHTP